MPTVIPVKFRYAARDLWFDPQDTGAVEGDHVICSTERGTEIGLVTADAREVGEDERREMCGNAELKPIVRMATDADLDRADELAERGDEAMPVFRRLVSESGLDMKPVGVEFLFGGEKAVCYFSAEERVDFRQLVRDMARELHERIDMRQIGVREEAAIVGGFAHCGQELCCARFGHQFEPVSIRMAKEQDLPLNSTKISGACGRLMCCLRYEFEAYRDFKGRAPKRNAVIDTPLGKAKIVEYDTPKEQLTLRLENGKQVRVALADMVASDAAVKKSEELHCACRPDTVTREALERLASPEVLLALAELDREAGVLTEDTFTAHDLFVEQPRSRRRRRGGQQAADAAQDEASAETPAEVPAEGQQRSRRRRKKRAAETDVATEPAAQPTPRQSRRTHTDAAEVPTPATQTRSRHRRHHNADDGSQAQGAEQPTQQRSARQQREAAQDGAPKPARRARRRPGDHGGEAAQAQRAQGQQQAQPQRAAQQQGQQAAGEPSASKRRRRRRGGRGKGTGEGAAPAPTGE